MKRLIESLLTLIGFFIGLAIIATAAGVICGCFYAGCRAAIKLL